MTTREYINNLRFALDDNGDDWISNPIVLAAALDNVAVWSDDAARGYCLLAAQRARLSPNQTARFLRHLDELLGAITPDDAAAIYDPLAYDQ